ncbi:MAG: addiction module protein [Bacteroidota bacterium]
MAELVEKILSLPKAQRLKIAMQILLSIQDEVEESLDWHLEELDKFQEELKKGNIKYLSEKDFWAEARKRVS